MANTYNTDLQAINANLQDILNTINELPSNDIALHDIALDPDVVKYTVQPDEGYDGFSSVTVNAMPIAEQDQRPTISIDPGTGIVTSQYSHGSGYVSENTHIATYSLNTQAATTITPSTINQKIPLGRYLTGNVTIAGDADLVASNIKSGVNIFGVTGTYTGAPSILMGGSETFSAAGRGGIVLFDLPTSIVNKNIHFISFSFEADHARLGTAYYTAYWPFKGDTAKVGIGSLPCAASMDNTSSGGKTLSFDITNANDYYDSDNFTFDFATVIYS